MTLIIKDIHKDEYVAFKGCKGKKLGELDQTQLNILALFALEANHKNLLDKFDGELPSRDELKKTLFNKEVNAIKK